MIEISQFCCNSVVIKPLRIICSISLFELTSVYRVNVSHISGMNFFVFLPVLDLYSGKYNAFHHLCHSKNIKDTCVE